MNSEDPEEERRPAPRPDAAEERDQARERLYDVIEQYGVGVIQTSVSCAYALNQHRDKHPAQTDALVAVLKAGIPHKILAHGDKSLGALNLDAQEKADLDPDLAEWAVKSWALVLLSNRPAASARPWEQEAERADASPPPSSTASFFQKSVLFAGLLAAVGAIGGGSPGLEIGTLAQQNPDLVAEHYPTLHGMVQESGGPLGFTLLASGIGAIFAGSGSGLGWMLGGGSQMMATGRTTVGRIAFGCIGAFILAHHGASIGLVFGGPVGAGVGGLIAALAGSFMGYLIGPYILVVLLFCCCVFL